MEALLEILLSPPVLVTILVAVLILGSYSWVSGLLHRRRQSSALAEQRQMQEAALQRVLEAVARDKDEVIAQYEERLRAKEQEIAALQRETARLRDRLGSSGLLGLFGGRQRDVVSALLLENEQLHELLAKKQEQLRELMHDMTDKLMARIEEQAEESARAVRYKQALLSAFLQHQEARELLDRLVAEGRLQQPTLPAPGNANGEPDDEGPAHEPGEPDT